MPTMIRKPNVLQLIQSFHQGGSERQAVQLTRLLHETGRYDVQVACLKGEGLLREPIDALGLPPVAEFPLVSFYAPGTAAQLWRFASFLRRRQIDIVQAHDFSTTIFGMTGAALAGVPARVAARRETDPDRARVYRWIERRAFGLADAVVVNAGRIADDLTRAGVPAHRIHTVHNGVDLARFEAPPAARREEILGSLGVPTGRHRQFVTIVANLWLPIKDHPTFLRAAARVRREAPGTGFILAGEGALIEPLRQLAQELGIAGDVFFIGRCARVPELLAASDVCVLSSTSEGFPNAVIEYMAAGRPVVATRVGGVPEAVVDGKTGYLVAPGDDQEMAGRMAMLLGDDSMRRAMGASGRAVAAANFSLAAQLARTEQVYEELLSRAPVRRPALSAARAVREAKQQG